MNKNRKISFLILPLLGLFAVSCAPTSADLNKAKTYVRQEYANFLKEYPNKGLLISDGWSNNVDTSGAFGVTWNKNQVTGNENEGLILGIEKTDDLSLIKDAYGEQAPDFDPYLGGEVRTTRNYKYGFFGTYMKPSKVTGTVSTFFTYTGPTEDNPHDEIDIEFLGKDTTKVQFNYYAGSDQGHEVWHNLGFDASEDYHHYGFYWDNKEITWYVDFKPVFRLENIATPSHKCKVFINHWKTNSKNANICAWGGSVNDNNLPSKAYFKEINIATMNGAPMSVLPKGIAYDYLPKEDELIAAQAAIETKSSEYSVQEDSENNSFDISYTAMKEKSYKNIKFTVADILDTSFEDYKWLAMDLENKSADPIKVRITVNDSQGGSSFLKLTKGWVNGDDSKMTTNSDSTIAHIDVPANNKVNFILHYYGLDAQSFYLMIDSTDRDEGYEEDKSGRIIIDNFRVGGEQDYNEESDDDVPTEIFPSDEKEPKGLVDTMYTFDNATGTTSYAFTSGSEGTNVAFETPASNYTPALANNSFTLSNPTYALIEIKNLTSSTYKISFIYRITSGADGATSGELVSSNNGSSSYSRYSSGNGAYFILGADDIVTLKINLKGSPTQVRFIANVGGDSSLSGNLLIKSWKTYNDI